MCTCSNVIKNRNCVIKILKHIASFKEKELVILEKIYPDEENNACNHCVLSLAVILSVLGVIELRYKENEPNGFIIKSLTAKYFILSFAEYVQNGLELFSQWEEDKGRFPVITENNIFFGVQFLNLMEAKRIEACPSSRVLGLHENSRVIIKSQKDGKDVILYQYDPKSSQYKLIGGSKTPEDKNFLETIKREIREELLLSTLRYNDTYKLNKVHEVSLNRISYRFGGYVTNKAEFYHMYGVEEKNIKLGQHDRWIKLSEIRANKTLDGADIYPIDRELYDKLSNLGYSIKNKKEDKSPLRWLKNLDKKEKISIISLAVAIFFGVIKIIKG